MKKWMILGFGLVFLLLFLTCYNYPGYTLDPNNNTRFTYPVDGGSIKFGETIQWQAVEMATSYQLYLIDNDTEEEQLIADTTETQAIFPEIILSKYYTLRLISNTPIQKLQSDIQIGVAPIPPGGVSPSMVYDEGKPGIGLNWINNPEDRNYPLKFKIYYTTDGTIPTKDSLFIQDIEYNGTFMDENHPQADMTYNLAVVPYNEIGEADIMENRNVTQFITRGISGTINYTPQYVTKGTYLVEIHDTYDDIGGAFPNDPIGYQTFNATGSYTLVVAGGIYYLRAYRDFDDNLMYDTNMDAYGEYITAIDVNTGIISGIDLNLTEPPPEYGGIEVNNLSTDKITYDSPSLTFDLRILDQWKNTFNSPYNVDLYPSNSNLSAVMVTPTTPFTLNGEYTGAQMTFRDPAITQFNEGTTRITAFNSDTGTSYDSSLFSVDTIPILQGVTIIDSSVAAGVPINVQVQFDDMDGIIFNTEAFLYSPTAWGQGSEPCTRMENLVLSDMGSYWEGSRSLESYHEPGTWIIGEISISDSSSHYRTFRFDAAIDNDNYYYTLCLDSCEDIVTDIARTPGVELTGTTADCEGPDLLSATLSGTFPGSFNISTSFDTSGSMITEARVDFKSPSGIQAKHFCSTEFYGHTLSEQAIGVWEDNSINIESYYETGTWKITYIFVMDQAGNSRHYYYDTSISSDYYYYNNESGNDVITTVPIAGQNLTGTSPDCEPPQITSITINPTSIDASLSETFDVDIQFSDASAANYAYAYVRSPNNYNGNEFCNHQVGIGFSDMGGNLHSSTSNSIDMSYQSGTWTLDSIQTSDLNDNEVTFVKDTTVDATHYVYWNIDTESWVTTTTEFATLNVTGTTADCDPPELASVTVTPSSINGSGNVTLSATLTEANLINNVEFLFVSPTQWSNPGQGDSFVLYPSDMGGGVWEIDYFMDSGLEYGTWNIGYIMATDNFSNTRYYRYNPSESTSYYVYEYMSSYTITTVPIPTGVDFQP